MSNQILTQLLDAHALDGSPLHADMAAFHVPFDDRGRGGTDSSVIRAAQSTERLVVGATRNRLHASRRIGDPRSHRSTS